MKSGDGENRTKVILADSKIGYQIVVHAHVPRLQCTTSAYESPEKRPSNLRDAEVRIRVLATERRTI